MSIYEILPALDLTLDRPCQNIHRNAPGGQIKNFQNTLDRAWNEIRMKNRQKISSES